MFCVLRAQVGAGAAGIFRVDVTDTGAGIAAEDQKKLFGEFTQFNKNELQAGGRNLTSRF